MMWKTAANAGMAFSSAQLQLILINTKCLVEMHPVGCVIRILMEKKKKKSEPLTQCSFSSFLLLICSDETGVVSHVSHVLAF